MDPYIGVTGFMDRKEVESVLEVFPVNSSRKLMVGVLVSNKTLDGQPNRQQNRYPDRRRVEDIFSDNPLALNLVHYNTRNPENLIMEIGIFADLFGGPNLHGFQLNAAWPSPNGIEIHRVMHEGVIVLQVGGYAFRMVGNSPEKLAKRVAEYKGLVEYLLLDPSGGRGQPFDTETARAYLRALADKDLGIGLGVAGGLNAETLHLVQPLVEEFPDLSTDAESRLRDVADNLILPATNQYVSVAREMFEGQNK